MSTDTGRWTDHTEAMPKDDDPAPSLRQRLQNEADLCRNDGADDIARLLDEAADALKPLTDEQIAELVLRVVYEGDASVPYRAEWTAATGVPFLRAIERAHGVGGEA